MRVCDVTEARYPRTPSGEALAAAAEAGFDTKLWYHGTRRRFDGFRLPKERGIDELGPGVYVTSEQWLANTWARKGGFILICVVRHGPLFDLAQINRPATQAILKQGYRQNNLDQWGPSKMTDDAMDETFTYVWQQGRNRPALINRCLAGAGYVGGYKHDSQIRGQIVVFKPEDVQIVARKGGQAYME